MKLKGEKKRKTELLPIILTSVLFVALISITVALIVELSSSSEDRRGDFDMGMIMSDGTEYEDISDMLVPEFIGITSDGTRKGITASAKIVKDIFRMISPTIACIFEKNDFVECSDEDWNALTKLEDTVYVRLHSELPTEVLKMFVSMLDGDTLQFGNDTSLVYEMFIIPYSEKSDTVRLYIRSLDGEVRLYSANKPEKYISESEISRIIESYSQSLSAFCFSEDEYESLSFTEPILEEGIQASRIIITNKTSEYVYDMHGGVDTVLEVFGMNPDKVMASNNDDDSSTGYIDSRGAFYVRDSAFEYRSTVDGGIPISKFIGYTPVGEMTYIDCIRAACTLFRGIRKTDKLFAGNNADAYVSYVSAENGRMTVELSYCFNNIQITDTDPALHAVFENGTMREANINTVSVTAWNEKSVTSNEFGFADYLVRKGIKAYNVSTKYRADFSADFVNAEWIAECIE